MSVKEFVDDGFRVGDRFARRFDQESSRSRSEERAVASDEGAWSEELGVDVLGSDMWIVPGKGLAGPRCGEYYPDAVCDECGEVEFGSHQCGRRECPDCWGIWAKQSGKGVTRRIQEFRNTQPDNWKRQVIHGVDSPPEGSIKTFKQFKQAWKKSHELAGEKGMRGGVVIPHPWRVCEDAKRRYSAVDRDVGIWSWLRGEYGEDWREAVYWSPHFHIIGFTTPDMEPGDVDKDDGWMWKFIRSLERFEGPRDKSSTEDVYGAVRYLLSHTGFRVDKDMKSVRYFGCLAPTSFTEADKPSDGIQRVIERTVEDVAGGPLEDDEDGSGGGEDDSDREQCSCEDCSGEMIDVFDIEAYLQHHDPPPDVTRRMMVAYDWRMGRLQLPAGLSSPRSEGEANEAFEYLIDSY